MINLKQTERTATKIEKKVKKTMKVVRFWLVIVAILTGASLAILTLMRINAWFNDHKFVFRSPVEFFQPISIVKREIASPVATSGQIDEDKVLLGEIYVKVRYLESRAGMDKSDITATHIYCQTQGLTNEVGYHVNGDKHFCFKDEAEQEKTIKRWFSKRLFTEKMDLATALCFYNLGRKEVNCKYYQSYLEL